MATLRGEPVDRPAVNFYEIGGLQIDPADPDPYNIYNAPGWQPLLKLAAEHTDIIRMMSPVRARSIDPTGSAVSACWHEFFREETSDDGNTRVTRTTLTVAGRTMTQVTKRERELNTVWTVEHLLKDAEDAEAYLAIPDEAFAERIDTGPVGSVALAPVDMRGSLFHQKPGTPISNGTHQIESHARFNHPVWLGSIRITIEGNDILAGSKLPVIQRPVEAHEIGCYRQVGRDGM